MKLEPFLYVLATLALAACGGSDDGASDGTLIDAGPAPVCSGAIYEPCTADTDCMSGVCRQFNAIGGIFLCTQACGAGCPTLDGAAVECNKMGTACKPLAAARCDPP